MFLITKYTEEPTTTLWSPFHIVYMILTIIAVVVSLILIKKYVKSENTIKWILRGVGIALFIIIILNRIDVLRYKVNIGHETNMVFGEEVPYSWIMIILPFTPCALSSTLIPFTTFLKKDHWFTHSIYIIALIGGAIGIFYPSFLNDQYLYEIRTWGSLAHHVLSMWIVILMLMTGYIKPSMKKIHFLPIALSFIVAMGLFELQAMHYAESMGLAQKFAGLEWYVPILGYVLFDFVFVFLFEKFVYKKKIKEIFNFRNTNK